MYKEGVWKDGDIEMVLFFGRWVGLYGFGLVVCELVKLIWVFGVEINVCVLDVMFVVECEWGVWWVVLFDVLFVENDVVVEFVFLILEIYWIVGEE